MLYRFEGQVRGLVRSAEDFGFQVYDLASLPLRLQGDSRRRPLVESNIDRRRVQVIASPAEMAVARANYVDESWPTISSRALARLYAAFLVAEDPQRRLEARKAATLMHQVSLVRHILERPDLQRVLIADEVGLGKTIEAGLLIKALLERDPGIRVLYLAPARLVKNVSDEFRDKLDLDARVWVSGSLSNARLVSDWIVIASINKAVVGDNFDQVVDSGPWGLVIVDECHHLSDWDIDGGSPNQAFRLVSKLRADQSAQGRLVLMSGTPHQGNEARFLNILRLLSDDGKSVSGAEGRVIFRTKDRVLDWRGQPLFPTRDVRKPHVVALGERYERWYQRVGGLYEVAAPGDSRSRATGWAKGQALQWAASSLQSGMGFLVRLAMRRLGWGLEMPVLRDALAVLRPYRGGAVDEPLPLLFDRMVRLARPATIDGIDLGDVEAMEEGREPWLPDSMRLASLLREGVDLIEGDAGRAKWDAVFSLIEAAGGEKIVLFAQPVETVTLVAGLLESRYGVKPSLIIGNQSDDDRLAEVARFQADDGPQFLVSSRAGGEGLNMQRARRLIHLDVPWNPMEMEQRIGRIHRFGSRKTVLVDTVVVAGSREVDMYRIAREKLALVVRHLDPEQFETLFGRVMSLVPPTEFESVMVGFLNDGPTDDRADFEIGRLVTAGYQSWSAFDDAYRHQAEQIRATSPGEARWADLGAFLVKYGGARDGEGATFSTFRFEDAEIVAVDERVPTIVLGGTNFSCGDTGGLNAVGRDNLVAVELGLNHELVQQVLHNSFRQDKVVGAAFVKSVDVSYSMCPAGETVVLLAFLRQELSHEAGQWVEGNLTLHTFLVAASGDVQELDSCQRAELVRALQNVVRVKAPTLPSIFVDIVAVERDLFDQLRRPAEAEIAKGTRFAVWPLAAVVMLPG